MHAAGWLLVWASRVRVAEFTVSDIDLDNNQVHLERSRWQGSRSSDLKAFAADLEGLYKGAQRQAERSSFYIPVEPDKAIAVDTSISGSARPLKPQNSTFPSSILTQCATARLHDVGCWNDPRRLLRLLDINPRGCPSVLRLSHRCCCGSGSQTDLRQVFLVVINSMSGKPWFGVLRQGLLWQG